MLVIYLTTIFDQSSLWKAVGIVAMFVDGPVSVGQFYNFIGAEFG